MVQNIMTNDMKLDAQSIVVRSEGTVEAAVDGEVVALNIESGSCYGLNGIGSRIWGLLATPHRVMDICATLMREYDVDHETCEREVLDLLEALRAETLIEMAAEHTA